MFIPAISVMQPEIGILFWTVLVFLIVLFILRTTAYKPIVEGLKKREFDIQEALDAAEEAKKEMAKLKEENAEMLQEAREEKMRIINDAKETRKNIVKEAETEAKEKAKIIMSNAQDEIENSKRAAMQEVKNEAGMLAIQITEQLTKKQLENKDQQEKLVKEMINEAQLN